MRELNTGRDSDLFISLKLSAEQLELYAEQGYSNVGAVLANTGLERVTTELMEAWLAEKGV